MVDNKSGQSTNALTIDDIMALKPCMSRKKIEDLVGDNPLTLETLDSLDIPIYHKIWLLCHECFIPAKELRLFACDVAEEALIKEKIKDERIWNAVAVSRKYANGEATEEELDAARYVMGSAAFSPAKPSAHCASYRAASYAAYYAASYAACSIASPAGSSAEYHTVRESHYKKLRKLYLTFNAE